MTPKLLPLVLIAALAGCAGPRSYSRSTMSPLPDAFACATRQLEAMGYTLALVDSIGGVVQGHREITGLREAARRGAASATEVITVGLAGGPSDRFDELTVTVYMRNYPHGNTIEATAGLLTVADKAREQSAPSDDAKRDARDLLAACAVRG